jgi:triosephosphate isomerase
MTARPRPLIAGNWKMNGLERPALAEIGKLSRKLKARKRVGCDVLICPPATLLAPLGRKIKDLGLQRRLAVGGQDCHGAASGAHTGDIAAEMLADAGCRYVIVGHSERRADHGESDAVVKAKAEAALRAGLTAIVCVGETLKERDAGQALRVVGRQVKGSLPAGATAKSVVVAYEPVWAIGTGRTPTAEDVAKVHAHIRKILVKSLKDGSSVRILYGGSVKASNAGELMAISNVDGALVGGASLTAADFWPIVLSKG